MLNVTTMRRECISQRTENIPPRKGTHMNVGHFIIVRSIKRVAAAHMSMTDDR